MMKPEQIETLIRTHLTDCDAVEVRGDDGTHFDAVVVSAAFEGLSPVKRQQMVYAAVNTQIASGELHALSLKTMTPEEFRAHNLT